MEYSFRTPKGSLFINQTIRPVTMYGETEYFTQHFELSIQKTTLMTFNTTCVSHTHRQLLILQQRLSRKIQNFMLPQHYVLFLCVIKYQSFIQHSTELFRTYLRVNHLYMLKFYIFLPK